jgi:hypothetical protein
VVQRESGKANLLRHDKLRLGICWFKAASTEHISRIWEMVQILESNGIYGKKIRTDKPGYVISEDEWQLVAEPFRKGTMPRSWNQMLTTDRSDALGQLRSDVACCRQRQRAP